VLVVGHEVIGVDPGVLELCDQRVAIPMLGKKHSLNVATAFGVAAYALRLA
jgi:tRNA G18 (ribose-2'-O)-methylase SpoU